MYQTTRTLFVLPTLLFSSAVFACTVFSAVGDDLVKGGGTLLAKVRDEHMTTQEVKTVYPENGYPFTGLFAGKKNNFNMGVNSKGLVIFRTTASSIPKAERKKAIRFKTEDGKNSLEYLIRSCATVDEALKHPEAFKEPVNFMIADSKKIAIVEVGRDGKYSVQVKDHGTLTHTNHFILPDREVDNTKIGKSSKVRLARINELLETSKKPFTQEQFITFTKDQNAGSNNSIFRTGKEGVDDPIRTLSVMVVHLPKDGAAPKMYLRWRDKKDDLNSWQEFNREITFKK